MLQQQKELSKLGKTCELTDFQNIYVSSSPTMTQILASKRSVLYSAGLELLVSTMMESRWSKGEPPIHCNLVLIAILLLISQA